MKSVKFTIETAEAMVELGCKIANLAKKSKQGIIVFLKGELGAGKTTLVRGFLRAFDYHGMVKSPTYTLVEPYQIEDDVIYHFDFYRIHSPSELELMGYRDYFDGKAHCLIEWPQKAQDFLPTADLKLNIEIEGFSRTVEIHLAPYLHQDKWLNDLVKNDE